MIKNVDAKRERRARVERFTTAVGAAIAVVVALRKLIHALADLGR